ncbi:MAG: hypothetical protein ACYCQJ_12755 [Nitrososphaerales archaeon]
MFPIQSPAKTKFTGFRSLRDGYSYYTTSDSNYVIGVKVPLVKLLRVVDEKGDAISGPTGEPIYSINVGNPIIRILSPEEWKVLKELEGFE